MNAISPSLTVLWLIWPQKLKVSLTAHLFVYSKCDSFPHTEKPNLIILKAKIKSLNQSWVASVAKAAHCLFVMFHNMSNFPLNFNLSQVNC